MTVESAVGRGPRVAALAEVPLPLWVEEEFLLVWPDGDAACVAPGVLAAVAPELRVHPGPAPFQVRTATGPCSDLAALARGMSIPRRALAEAAADQGARLVSLGTLPFDAPGTGARGEPTSTCQVSVPVPSPDLAEAVVDRCRGWVPTLLALTGNSALWRGRDTGWSSHRFVLRTRSAPGGDPSWAGLAPGDRAADYRAVDFRVADSCPTGTDAVLLAGLCRGLAAVALAQEAAGRPRPHVPDRVVAASARAAAHWGLGAFVLDPTQGGTAPAAVVLDSLVSTVAPALDAAGDLPLVAALLRERLRRGSGADRQRSLRRRYDRRALVQTLANTCAGVDRQG